jgi:hypothetical protein
MNDVAILGEKRHGRVNRRGSVFTTRTPGRLRGVVTNPGMCEV